MDDRKRWIALYVLCLGSLMIVLDATIVNVALPSIREDLGFSQTSLAWVVNAYLLTYGGLLLLGGRLGDLFGHRRLFIYGITLFTLSSLACGLSAFRREPVITRDVVAEPLWQPWLWLAREFDYRACWSFPVAAPAGPVLGTFAMYYREPRDATPPDLDLAATITRTAAFMMSPPARL